MSNVVSCPSCRHALSLPAELLGRAVRCPVCKAEFTAAAPAVPPLPVVPTLSLDENAAPEAPAPRRNLWGAVEVGSSGEPPPAPRAPDPEPPPERPRSPGPDGEGRTRCSECGARIPAGAPCCARCGTRPDGDR